MFRHKGWAKATRKPPWGWDPRAKLRRLRKNCLGTEVGRVFQAEETAGGLKGWIPRQVKCKMGLGRETGYGGHIDDCGFHWKGFSNFQ